MASPSQSSPLDLDQFGPTLANPDAAALLAECRRQREEIARLRAALGSLTESALPFQRCGRADEARALRTDIAGARAALADAGEGGAE